MCNVLRCHLNLRTSPANAANDLSGGPWRTTVATPYTRTLRSLAADSPWGWTAGLVIVSLLLVAWLGWALHVELGVYAESIGARLETSSGAHPVEAEVGGRITAVHVTVGQLVDEGEMLFELEAADSRLLLGEAQDRAQALAGELAGVQRQLVAEEAAAAEARTAADAELEEAQARLFEAEARVELAEAEAERARELYEAGLLSSAELQRARSEASQRRWSAEAQKVALLRLERSQRSRASDRMARMEALRAEVTSLQGDLRRARSQIERLRLGVARRTVRAPIAGVVGERDLLTPGTLVEAGDRVATVVPESGFKIVADFDPAQAMGRIRPGQPAVARLEGFPWTQFGTLPAKVTTVASELRDDRVHVELELVLQSGQGPPLAHGLPARVEVEVERVPAAVLFLRAAGGRFGPVR